VSDKRDQMKEDRKQSAPCLLLSVLSIFLTPGFGSLATGFCWQVFFEPVTSNQKPAARK